MWKPALRSETDPEWKTTSLLAAIKNPLKYRTDYKSSSEPWDNQSFSPGLIQQPLYSSILNNRILSSMQAKATCGHSKVSLLSQEWLIIAVDGVWEDGFFKTCNMIKDESSEKL